MIDEAFILTSVFADCWYFWNGASREDLMTKKRFVLRTSTCTINKIIDQRHRQ